MHILAPSDKRLPMHVLHEQTILLDVKQVEERKYSHSTIVRVFMYFSLIAIAQTSCDRFRNDFELPRITTLTRLTSATKRYDEVAYYTRRFSNLPNEQRTCVLPLTEIYVKCLLQYHGDEVLGQATNDPNKLANTMLS